MERGTFLLTSQLLFQRLENKSNPSFLLSEIQEFWHNRTEVNRPHDINRLWEPFCCSVFCYVFYIQMVSESMIKELELKGASVGNKKYLRKFNLASDYLILQTE